MSSSGQLVVSCWEHYFSLHQGFLRYRDHLSRWSGNRPGNNLLREHLVQAQEQGLVVRLVIAHATDTAPVDAGGDASVVEKTFDAREDLVGRVVEFDGDAFVIDFSPGAHVGARLP